jgi:multiple sugar transport system substrate-binding protein
MTKLKVKGKIKVKKYYRIKVMMFVMALCAIMLLAAACGNSDQTGQASQTGDPAKPAAKEEVKAAPQPVTLTMYNFGSFTDEDIQSLVVDPVKKKLPYITMKFITRGGAGTLPEDLAAAGTDIDLILTNTDVMGRFDKLGYYYDMKADFKKINFDIGKFDAAAAPRSTFDGKLAGLPFNIVRDALFYNKDIFDKFGVSYPKDGLVWEDIIEMSKKLTRTDSGVQYRGFDPVSVLGFAGLTVVDFKTNKALIGSPEWRTALETFKQIISIPGNEKFGPGLAQTADAFVKDQTVAMAQTDLMSRMEDASSSTRQLNWDLAQAVSFKGHPNVAGWGQSRVISVSANSKHKDAALDVFKLLFSDEVQMAASRGGKFSLLKNQAIQDNFGTDLAYLKGKNIKAFFKSQPGPVRDESVYYSDITKTLNQRFKEFTDGKTDINTTIRVLEEEINSQIAAAAK